MAELYEILVRFVNARTSSVRVNLVSPLNTFRRRWTVNLYVRSCFKTHDDGTRLSRTEPEIAFFNLRIQEYTGLYTTLGRSQNRASSLLVKPYGQPTLSLSTLNCLP